MAIDGKAISGWKTGRQSESGMKKVTFVFTLLYFWTKIHVGYVKLLYFCSLPPSPSNIYYSICIILECLNARRLQGRILSLWVAVICNNPSRVDHNHMIKAINVVSRASCLFGDVRHWRHSDRTQFPTNYYKLAIISQLQNVHKTYIHIPPQTSSF